jgi:hypothetical protein
MSVTPGGPRFRAAVALRSSAEYEMHATIAAPLSGRYGRAEGALQGGGRRVAPELAGASDEQ